MGDPLGEAPRSAPEESRPPVGGSEGERPPLVRAAVIFYGVVFGIAAIWSALSGRSFLFASAAAEIQGLSPWRDAAIGLLAGAIVILISGEITRRTDWGENLARVLGAVLGPLTVSQCVLLAALSGIAEEALFRGVLQPRIGLVAASLLFGLAHFAPRRELLPWTGFSVLAGFLLGGLFELTGNLVAPIVAHAVVNAVNLRLLAVRYGTPGAHAPGPNGQGPGPGR